MGVAYNSGCTGWHGGAGSTNGGVAHATCAGDSTGVSTIGTPVSRSCSMCRFQIAPPPTFTLYVSSPSWDCTSPFLSASVVPDHDELARREFSQWSRIAHLCLSCLLVDNVFPQIRFEGVSPVVMCEEFLYTRTV